MQGDLKEIKYCLNIHEGLEKEKWKHMKKKASMFKSNQETKYSQRWWLVRKYYEHEGLVKNEKQWRCRAKPWGWWLQRRREANNFL